MKVRKEHFGKKMLVGGISDLCLLTSKYTQLIYATNEEFSYGEPEILTKQFNKSNNNGN